MAITTYSFRRFSPTVAGMLRMDATDRLAIGDWQDVEGSKASRSETSFMPVRYDGDRVANALAVKGECVLAVGQALASYRAQCRDNSVTPHLSALREHLPPMLSLRAQVASRMQQQASSSSKPSSSTVAAVARKRKRAPAKPNPNVYLVSDEESSPATPVQPLPKTPPGLPSDSASSDSDSSSSRQSSVGTDNEERITWVLPSGGGSCLHIGRAPPAGTSTPLPLCSGRPLAWGAEWNVGLDTALATGRGWCKKCARNAPKAIQDIILPSIVRE